MRDVLQPSLATLVPAVGPARDLLQAYCDVLEEKWLLSEAAGRDVGLEAALDAYLSLGAPAPEEPDGRGSIALDIDWSGGFDATGELDARRVRDDPPEPSPWPRCSTEAPSRPVPSSAFAA